MESFLNFQPINFKNFSKFWGKFKCIPNDDFSLILLIRVLKNEKRLSLLDVKKQSFSSSKSAKVNKNSLIILHPKEKIVGVSSEKQIQIYDFENFRQISSLKSNFEILFLSFVKSDVIFVTGNKEVWKWSFKRKEKSRIFILDQKLCCNKEYQITCNSKKWFLVSSKINSFKKNSFVQLYSTKDDVSQIISGFYGFFIDNLMVNRLETSNLVCICQQNENEFLCHICEIPNSLSMYEKKTICVPIDSFGDVLFISCVNLFEIIVVVCKNGFFLVYDVSTAKLLYKERLSIEIVFAVKNNENIIIYNKESLIEIKISPRFIIKYLLTINKIWSCYNIIIKKKLCEQYVDVLKSILERLLDSNLIDEAINFVVVSPKQVLRKDKEVIQMFLCSKGMLISSYFQNIIEIFGNLNQVESIELTKLVVSNKKIGYDYIKNLITSKKMQKSEELGLLLHSYDSDLSLLIFLSLRLHKRVIECLIQQKSWEKIIFYKKSQSLDCSFFEIFQKLSVEDSVDFATKVYQNNREDINPELVVEHLMKKKMVEEATKFLLNILNENKKEDSKKQTLLFQINLEHNNLLVVEEIFRQNMYNMFDHQKVGKLCEIRGLIHRAFECYSRIEDYKRLIVNNQYWVACNHLVIFDLMNKLSSENRNLILMELISRNGDCVSFVELIEKIIENFYFTSSKIDESVVQLLEKYEQYEIIFFYLFHFNNNKRISSKMEKKFKESAISIYFIFILKYKRNREI